MRPRHATGDQTSTATTRRALSGATLDLPAGLPGAVGWGGILLGRPISQMLAYLGMVWEGSRRAKLMASCVQRLAMNR